MMPLLLEKVVKKELKQNILDKNNIIVYLLINILYINEYK